MEHAPYAQAFSRYPQLLRVGKGLAAAVLAACVVVGSAYGFNRLSSPSDPFASTPTWEQDFTQAKDGLPDPSIWRHELNPAVPGWNNEKQAYTNSSRNVRIENGTLQIDALREPYQYPNDPSHHSFAFTSGRIDTQDRFEFRYGKLEARLKLPAGGGAWPAFWLLSGTNAYTENLSPTEQAEEGAYTRDGEIDIMENAANDGCEVSATVHTYETRQNPPSDSTIVPNCTTSFHTYTLEWEPKSLTFLVDDEPYFSVKKTSDRKTSWPFDQPAFLILNLAMGGEMGGHIDPTQAHWNMQVQSLRYYPYQGK